MKREQWVAEANAYLISLTGEWDKPEFSEEYCESLYETYVIDDSGLLGEDFWSPKDAVDEDMTYWDAE
jgi:hypothetical protein